MTKVVETDRLPKSDLQPVLLGLFGEVGSVMATAKKTVREKDTYTGFSKAAEEEFGDVLWYFNALCGRLNIPTDEILAEAANSDGSSIVLATSDLNHGPVAHISYRDSLPSMNELLLDMGTRAAQLLAIDRSDSTARARLCDFARAYLDSVQKAGLAFGQVVNSNLLKVSGRFLDPDPSKLPVFDSEFEAEEQLPWHFEIEVTQRKSGQSYLRWNGVFIGDPLTDNISDPDGYRFHDVFHFAYTAVLHWSPVVRALIKQKRKSDKKTDEAEDGGRAIVVEEGLTAWIFSRAKQADFFRGKADLPFDLLKRVHEFVDGYEVAECPLRQWEKAILEGYTVFRQVRENKGGLIVGDRGDRSLQYQPF